jgi:hypothetical protein
MRLYGISEDAVISLMEGKDFSDEADEIRGIIDGFDLPVKVVFTRENDYYIIITAYPLKRGRDESIL